MGNWQPIETCPAETEVFVWLDGQIIQRSYHLWTSGERSWRNEYNNGYAGDYLNLRIGGRYLNRQRSLRGK